MPFQRIDRQFISGGFPIAYSGGLAGRVGQCIWRCEHGGVCRDCRRPESQARLGYELSLDGRFCTHGVCKHRCTHDGHHGLPDSAPTWDIGETDVVHHCHLHVPFRCSNCIPVGGKRSTPDAPDDTQSSSSKRARPNAKERKRNRDNTLAASGRPAYML